MKLEEAPSKEGGVSLTTTVCLKNLSTFFIEFLDLFLPDIATYIEPESLIFLDKEVFTDVTVGEQYEADLIAIRFRAQESYFLVHVENQAKAQSRFGARMFRYFARLYEKFALPIALFSDDAPQRPEVTYHQVVFPDFEVLRFNFRVIQLNRLNWRDFLAQPNPVASGLMAKIKIVPQERPRVKAECLRLLATLQLNRAKNKLISGFIDTYLRLNTTEEQRFLFELGTIEPEARELLWKLSPVGSSKVSSREDNKEK